MTPELHREYPSKGEDLLFRRMVENTVSRMTPRVGKLRRGQHAKPIGCVKCVFRVCDDVPSELRYGVFREVGRSFEAIARFSNSSESIDRDGKGTARGMAVKLLDVEGEPAIAGSLERSQDFLMVNNPAFPFAKPAEYVRFFNLRRIPIVGEIAAVAWMAIVHNRHLRIFKRIRDKVVASPLEITYWSGSPYRLGPPGDLGGFAVKYSAVPRYRGTAPPDNPKTAADDYLSRAAERRLTDHEVVFEFRVQIQTDPVKMPIEDASIPWSEEESTPITVGLLTIPSQRIDSPEGRAFTERCEAASFSPWNALAEHRPLGGINRLRKAVYLASFKKRTASGSR